MWHWTGGAEPRGEGGRGIEGVALAFWRRCALRRGEWCGTEGWRETACRQSCCGSLSSEPSLETSQAQSRDSEQRVSDDTVLFQACKPGVELKHKVIATANLSPQEIQAMPPRRPSSPSSSSFEAAQRTNQPPRLQHKRKRDLPLPRPPLRTQAPQPPHSPSSPSSPS